MVIKSIVLYVKSTTDARGNLIISFKEKQAMSKQKTPKTQPCPECGGEMRYERTR